jgi:hypothetical protein
MTTSLASAAAIRSLPDLKAVSPCPSIGFEDHGWLGAYCPYGRGGLSLERAQVQLHRAGLRTIPLVCPAPRSDPSPNFAATI